MSDYRLAHLNVVRPLGPLGADVPERIFFLEQVVPIFATADNTDGLFWHQHGIRQPDGSYLALPELLTLETEGGAKNPHVMTMAGWKDFKALHEFSHRMTLHVEGMKQLRHWVDRSEGPTMVMWWVPKGERVELEAAWQRLQTLRTYGPTPEAFTLQQRFDPPEAATGTG